MPGVLSLDPFGIKEKSNRTPLAMYPFVGFAPQAPGYVSKGRCFLSDAPFGRFRLPEPRGTSVRGGASLAMHLLVGFPNPRLAAFRYRRRTLSGRTVALHLRSWGRFGLDSCLLGPSGLESGLLGWTWGLPSRSLAYGCLLRLNLNSCCFLGLFVLCYTVVAYLPTNLFTFSARLLINTVSSHARRSISHKEIPQEQTNKTKTSERTKERARERTNERTHGQTN